MSCWALPAALIASGAQPRTMLHAVADLHLPFSGTSSLTATVLGRRGGEVLGRSPDTPVVLITQVVSVESTPLIAAKYALPSGAPGIPVRPSR